MKQQKSHRPLSGLISEMNLVVFAPRSTDLLVSLRGRRAGLRKMKYDSFPAFDLLPYYCITARAQDRVRHEYGTLRESTVPCCNGFARRS